MFSLTKFIEQKQMERIENWKHYPDLIDHHVEGIVRHHEKDGLISVQLQRPRTLRVYIDLDKWSRCPIEKRKVVMGNCEFLFWSRRFFLGIPPRLADLGEVVYIPVGGEKP